MKRIPFHRQLLRSILSGAYTPLDVREFVQLCYALALPLIRKKISAGKLNLNILKLREADIVYDCLADLFRRDGEGRFVEIDAYFNRNSTTQSSLADQPEEEMLLLLRRLVFAHTNKNIVRLYSEVDPVLGKVLRNIKLAVEKTQLFREEERFGEKVLVAEGADPLASSPPMPLVTAEQQFTRLVLLHDNAQVMVVKLHRMLIEQHQYQRLLPLVPAALMFKRVYQLSWEPEQREAPDVESVLQRHDVNALAQRVCLKLGEKMRTTYVKKGKVSEEVFQKYLLVLEDILSDEHEDGAGSYFEQLKRHVPSLTKRAYAKNHRKILEYLAKTAKRSLREELKTL